MTAFNCYLIGVAPLLSRCGEALAARGHRIEGVITEDHAAAEWAESRQAPLISPGRDLADRLKATPFDYLFSIATPFTIPDKVLALPREEAIRFHDGPLPAYAGWHAPAWALLNREKQYGIIWQVIDTAVAGGDILKQQAVSIAPDETTFTLTAKCREAGLRAFSELVDELAAGAVRRVPQDPDAVTYFGRYRRPAAAATLDFQRPAAEIDALVRALDFGPDPNPLALPKLRVDGAVYVVPSIQIVEETPGAQPGAITAVSPSQITVATATRSVALGDVQTLAGTAVSLSDLATRHSLTAGTRLPRLDAAAAQALSRLNEAVCRHEPFWVEQLGNAHSVKAPNTEGAAEASGEYNLIPFTLPNDTAGDADYLVAAFAAYLARLNGNESFVLGFTHDVMQGEIAAFAPYFAEHVPLRVSVAAVAPASEMMTALRERVAAARMRRTYARDLIARHPDLSPPRYVITAAQVASFAAYMPDFGAALALLVSPDGQNSGWLYDTALYPRPVVEKMQRQFAAFLHELTTAPHVSLAQLPLN